MFRELVIGLFGGGKPDGKKIKTPAEKYCMLCKASKKNDCENCDGPRAE